MTDVFISYSRRDKEFTQKFHDALVAAGKDAWVDWEGIPLTADWWKEIEDGIEESNAFVFIISPDSVQSDVCRDEIDYAVENQKRIIPILHREVIEQADKEKMHPVISSHNWIFFKNEAEFENDVAKVVQALDTDLHYVREHTRLLVRAREWDDNKRNDSFLLTGDEITEAEQWLARSAGKEPRRSVLHSDYIFASRRVAQQRQRRLLMGVSVALVITVILAVLSLLLFGQAESNRILAEGNAATAEANRLLADGNAATAESNAVLAENNAATSDSNAVLAENNAATADANALLAENNAATAEANRLLADSNAATADSNALLAENNAATSDSNALLAENNAATAESNAVLAENNAATAIAAESTAVRSATEAKSAALAAVAMQLIDSDRILGLGLAVEANSIPDPSLSVQRTLSEIAYGPGARLQLTGHAADIRAVDISPDGTLAVTGSIDGTIILWDIVTGQMIRTYDRHEDWVNTVAFHPSGEFFASGSDDGFIYFWDVNSDEILFKWQDPDWIYALDFSSDGDLFAFGTDVGTIGVVDWQNNKEIFYVEGHNNAINNLEFHPTERLFATASDDGTAILWDIDAQDAIYIFDGEGGNVMDVAFHPAGFSLVGVTNTRTLYEWSVDSGDTNWTVSNYHTDTIDSVEFHPSGDFLITMSYDRTMIVWDFWAERPLQTISRHADWIYDGAISADGSTLATVTGGPTDVEELIIWDLVNGAVERLYRQSEALYSLDITSDGQTLVAGNTVGEIYVIDRESGETLQTIDAHFDSVWTLDISNDDSKIVSGSLDGTIGIWDINTGEELLYLEEHVAAVNSVTFSADDTKIVSSSDDQTLYIWDSATGDLLAEYESPEFLYANVISKDGSKVFVAASDGSIKIVDMVTGDEIGQLSGHTDYVISLALTGDEMHIVSGSWDNTAILWDIASGQAIRSFSGVHTGQISAVAFNADETILLTVGEDNLVVLWDIASGEPIRIYRQHTESVRDAVFAPDGAFFTASFDFTIVQWRIDNFDELMTWVEENRYLRPFTCEQQAFYDLAILPECEVASGG